MEPRQEHHSGDRDDDGWGQEAEGRLAAEMKDEHRVYAHSADVQVKISPELTDAVNRSYFERMSGVESWLKTFGRGAERTPKSST